MRTQRGQILVLVALGMVGLIAFVALAIDTSRLYLERREAQNAADAAALAMAWEWIRTQGNCTAAVAKGLETASQLGYDPADPNVTVEAHCPPQDGIYAGRRGYFQVRIRSQIETTFLQVLRMATLANTAEAISRASMGTLFPGYAFVALSETGQGGLRGGIKFNGNSFIKVNRGGIFSNSNDADKSIWGVGTVEVQLDPGFGLDAVGGCTIPAPYNALCRTGMPQVDFETWVAQLDRIIPPIPSAPACSATIRRDVSNRTLAPGVYCVTRDVTFTNVTFQGKVVLVAEDVDIWFDGTIRAENLEIFVSSRRPTARQLPEVRMTAGVDFYAQRFRLFGDVDLTFRGGARMRSSNSLIYLNHGMVDWVGNITLELCAPPKNDPDGFGGLAVYMKYYGKNRSGTDIVVNGNTNNWIAGTFLAPYANVQYNGNSENVYDVVNCGDGRTSTQGYPSQVIAYALKFNGNSYSYVNYDPNFFFGADTIELVK